jgi:hypothetical protein
VSLTFFIYKKDLEIFFASQASPRNDNFSGTEY